jgi:hypothetical protein
MTIRNLSIAQRQRHRWDVPHRFDPSTVQMIDAHRHYGEGRIAQGRSEDQSSYTHASTLFVCLFSRSCSSAVLPYMRPVKCLHNKHDDPPCCRRSALGCRRCTTARISPFSRVAVDFDDSRLLPDTAIQSCGQELDCAVEKNDLIDGCQVLSCRERSPVATLLAGLSTRHDQSLLIAVMMGSCKRPIDQAD